MRQSRHAHHAAFEVSRTVAVRRVGDLCQPPRRLDDEGRARVRPAPSATFVFDDRDPSPTKLTGSETRGAGLCTRMGESTSSGPPIRWILPIWLRDSAADPQIRPARRTRIRATMQSAEHNKQENSAQALSKTFDHKENNGSSPVAQRVRSARGLRGLGRARGARDAPPLQREELADDTRATLLAQLSTLAAAQPLATKVDEALLRRDHRELRARRHLPQQQRVPLRSWLARAGTGLPPHKPRLGTVGRWGMSDKKCNKKSCVQHLVMLLLLWLFCFCFVMVVFLLLFFTTGCARVYIIFWFKSHRYK